jgi:hypothetical protein
MRDITKCFGIDCPLKEKCFRFTSLASVNQSYFINSPIKDGKCDMYWMPRVHNLNITIKLPKG